MSQRSKTAGAMALLPVAFMTTGCAAIEAVFKAGVWVGILGVLFVIGLGVAAAGMLGR